jgi:hypothetical protein
MWLFSKPKHLRVQSFVVKLVNNNCPGLVVGSETRRLDSRVNLTVVVVILPIENERIEVSRAFTAVTKEFSSAGVAVAIDQLEDLDRAILGFRFEGEMTFIRAKTIHRDPMGGGFFQVGFQLTEIVSPADYPELESVTL